MVEGPVTKRRMKRRTIRNVVIGGVVVIIVSIAAGMGWKVFTKVSASAQQADLPDWQYYGY